MEDEFYDEPFIPKRNRLGNKKWYDVMEAKFNDFLDKKNWLYDFSLEIPYNKLDCEARYLSQYFFSKLIDAIDNNFNMLITAECYAHIIKDKQEWIVHFDVMNNPKEGHLFGKSIKETCEDEWEKWLKYYHSIGNLTPIPWPSLGRASNNLQGIHNRLGERWDSFLRYCQKEWITWIENKKYSKESSFETYMKLTCQLVYYKKVCDLFEGRFGKCAINEISNEKLIDWYDSLDGINFKDEQIISFGEDLKDDAKRINRLISLRGKLMMALILRKKKL